MTQSNGWAELQQAAIAAEIKRLRDDAGQSAQWLSDETAKLGHRVSRSTIADIELRRRKYVTIAELIILARALGVPPLQLIYPDLPHGMVEVWPGEEVRSVAAAQWFSGELLAIDTDSGLLIYQPRDGDVPDRIGSARQISAAGDALYRELKQFNDTPADDPMRDLVVTRLDRATADLVRLATNAIRRGETVVIDGYPRSVQSQIEQDLSESSDDRARRIADEMRRGDG